MIIIIYKNFFEVLVYKNLEYISLLQSRAMLAEPSKMHRNRPLAVHPATIGRPIAIEPISYYTARPITKNTTYYISRPIVKILVYWHFL
jgi:hypothetical protein